MNAPTAANDSWWDRLVAWYNANYQENYPGSPQEAVDQITSRVTGSVPDQTKPAVRDLRPAYQFGIPASGKREALSPDDAVEVGDVLEVTYKCLPVFQAWQRDKLRQKLLADERITLLYLEHYPEQNRIVTHVVVAKQNPPTGYAVAAIGVALALGIGIWLSTSGIAKITSFEVDVNGDGKPEFKGGGIILLALAGIGLFLYTRSR